MALQYRKAISGIYHILNFYVPVKINTVRMTRILVTLTSQCHMLSAANECQEYNGVGPIITQMWI